MSNQCRVCGSSDFKRLFGLDKYSVCGCRNCRLRFLSPQPNEAILSSVYNEDYILSERTSEAEERVMKLKRATARLYLDHIKKYFPCEGTNLLEVGCGRGEFLIEARDRGFQVKGLEVFAHAVEIANRRLNSQNVLQATLEESPFPDEAFDVIVFFDVIEHIRNPINFLKVVYRKLKPGSRIFFCTPSVDSLLARMMGRYWMEYKIEHLFYFSRAAIRLALQAGGFHRAAFLCNRKVLSIGYIDHHFNRYRVPLLSGIVSAARKIVPDGLANRPLKFVDSNMFIVAEKAAQ